MSRRVAGNAVALAEGVGEDRHVFRTVHTDRLSLRPIELTDADLLVELHSDPEVMRYINGGRPMLRRDVTRFVSRSLGALWIAHAKASEAFVGWFELRLTGPYEYEIGYRLGRSHWGRGLATEGARALIALAFECLDAERVWAQTMTANDASRRVMERCGLRFVRTFHADWDGDLIPDGDQGDALYELRRQEWLGKDR